MSRKIYLAIAVTALFTSKSIAENGKGRAPEMVKSRTVTFDNIQVTGDYIDNPQTISITTVNKQDDTPVTLHRSFRDILSENIDKETVSRMIELQ